MALEQSLRDRLHLPAICAPMFKVTGPALVREACKAGVIGALPRANAGPLENFENWLAEIRSELESFREWQPEARIAPMAVNLSTRFQADEMRRHLNICGRNGVSIIITAAGDPTEVVRQVHDWGGKVFHDVTSLRFAEKAIAAGADGLTCIGAGGGGHSGLISHLSLIPKVRSMFDGVIVMAGAIATGAAIRAAEILGADLAYMGTRFIATQEAGVSEAYKQMLIEETSSGLLYTAQITGVPANWIIASLRQNGLDPADLPAPSTAGLGHSHLPAMVRPWKSLWSAGQAVDLIDDVPTVAELVARLRSEYVAACHTPDMAAAARLVDAATSARS